MLFLLNIRTELPGEWSPEQRADMLQREFTAGVKLMEQRVILRMFRVVGQLANFSVWQTATLEDSLARASRVKYKGSSQMFGPERFGA